MPANVSGPWCVRPAIVGHDRVHAAAVVLELETEDGPQRALNDPVNFANRFRRTTLYIPLPSTSPTAFGPVGEVGRDVERVVQDGLVVVGPARREQVLPDAGPVQGQLVLPQSADVDDRPLQAGTDLEVAAEPAAFRWRRGRRSTWPSTRPGTCRPMVQVAAALQSDGRSSASQTRTFQKIRAGRHQGLTTVRDVRGGARRDLAAVPHIAFVDGRGPLATPRPAPATPSAAGHVRCDSSRHDRRGAATSMPSGSVENSQVSPTTRKRRRLDRRSTRERGERTRRRAAAPLPVASCRCPRAQNFVGSTTTCLMRLRSQV